MLVNTEGVVLYTMGYSSSFEMVGCMSAPIPPNMFGEFITCTHHLAWFSGIVLFVTVSAVSHRLLVSCGCLPTSGWPGM